MLTINQRLALERVIIKHLIQTMAAHGWHVDHVWDGGSEVHSSELGGLLDAVFAVDESQIIFENRAGRQQYDRLIDAMRRLLNQGSIGRVIMGMAVVCDPLNECIDPDADCIEHHPKRQQMESALLWTLWHHQGGSSHIGQPIRKLLGIDQHARMTEEQISQAKAFGKPIKSEGGAA